MKILTTSIENYGFKKAQTQLLKLTFPCMVPSSYSKLRDPFMWLMGKILLQAFRKCIVYGVLNIQELRKIGEDIERNSIFV